MPVPLSHELLKTAMARVATIPVLINNQGFLIRVDQGDGLWFALVYPSLDFSEATGIQMLRLQTRLWAAGFHADQIATLVDQPRCLWGLRIWGPADKPTGHQALIRLIAVECGFNIFSEF